MLTFEVHIVCLTEDCSSRISNLFLIQSITSKCHVIGDGQIKKTWLVIVTYSSLFISECQIIVKNRNKIWNLTFTDPSSCTFPVEKLFISLKLPCCNQKKIIINMYDNLWLDFSVQFYNYSSKVSIS